MRGTEQVSGQRADENELTIWTYDWVPEGPRGFVRDLRLRWALEEAGLDYTVRAVPFEDRAPEHLVHQPFGQVPLLKDGDIVLFESGAGLLYLGRKSEALMPRDPKGEAEVVQWVISALNSIEIVSVPWWFVKVSGAKENPLYEWMMQRLDQLEKVMEGREWIAASRFTVADILMADVLRIPDVLDEMQNHPALRDYVTRSLARPAFQKACADQIDHFEAGDAARRGDAGSSEGSD